MEGKIATVVYRTVDRKNGSKIERKSAQGHQRAGVRGSRERLHWGLGRRTYELPAAPEMAAELAAWLRAMGAVWRTCYLKDCESKPG